MSMTPGPWRIVGGGRKILLFGEEQTHAIALIYPEGGKKRYEANARAIAGLPEALDILRDVSNVGEITWRDEIRVLAKRAYALLRRIEGKEETR